MADRDDPSVELYRKVVRGKPAMFRASSDFVRAARWLDAQGYHDAAAALSRASRTSLRSFWTEVRLQAFTIAMKYDRAPDFSTDERIATGATLSNAATFLRVAGLLLMLDGMQRVSSANALRIRRAIALLAVAVLDVIDEDWRTTRW